MDTTPIPASYASPTSFAVAGGYIVQFAAGMRVLADCGTDGARYGTVTRVEGTTVTLAMDTDGLTANLVSVLHGNDSPASLVNHAHTGSADGGLIGTATPTANAHPIASALGKLTAWIDAATTAVAGIVKLATTAMCQAGTDTTTAVTPAGLAASAKGIISTNTTIYVTTTGSDMTGDGSSGTPYASIAKALSSIAGKLIASGVVVTIQVADGTYTIASTIVIDHPDADKIQILGNTSAETTVAITSIDTTAKTITVAGDYAASIQVGDMLGLTGSSTSGVNGAYAVSGRVYSGGNTVITCSAETFASAAVGGGSIVIKPCNRCQINVSGDIAAFTVFTNTLLINGFRISVSSGTVTTGIHVQTSALNLGKSMVIHGLRVGIACYRLGNCFIDSGPIITGCQYGIYANYSSSLAINGAEKTILSKNTTIGAGADQGSFVYLQSTLLILTGNATDFSPAANTPGNYNSYIGS